MSQSVVVQHACLCSEPACFSGGAHIDEPAAEPSRMKCKHSIGTKREGRAGPRKKELGPFLLRKWSVTTMSFHMDVVRSLRYTSRATNDDDAENGGNSMFGKPSKSKKQSSSSSTGRGTSAGAGASRGSNKSTSSALKRNSTKGKTDRSIISSASLKSLKTLDTPGLTLPATTMAPSAIIDFVNAHKQEIAILDLSKRRLGDEAIKQICACLTGTKVLVRTYNPFRIIIILTSGSKGRSDPVAVDSRLLMIAQH